MKKIVLGILAHVDAGKTTLSEAMLYTSGTLRELGRVDHKNAFLDTEQLERERGITIFSKQARFSWKETEITLVDTPGHVDFSAEMERTLQVLDYAILVVSGSDGVQAHTETLWKLLEQYNIPTFVFINKMDLSDRSREEWMAHLQNKLSDSCVEFSEEQLQQNPEAYYEAVAMCDEEALDFYMEEGSVPKTCIIRLIKERKVFPCILGSALKLQGVEELLDCLEQYTEAPVYPEAFGARVYKIARDEQNNRLTYLKVTGGTLKARMSISGTHTDETGTHQWEEKVNQIRLYSGQGFSAEAEVPAGTVCAVTGLHETYPGEGLGREKEQITPVLEAVLTYQLQFEPDVDAGMAYEKIRVLSEEDPQLHVMWNQQTKEVHMQLMGEVQTEIIQHMIKERFGYAVTFCEGKIVYKETIAQAVEGVGHFEPLRHYAEVHLFLEPGERGSGLQFETDCSEDQLDKNWQRLILTHLQEKVHVGVLTGSPITDMKITLVAGRAHNKHTEGGDFRQATYRAVRQGLKSTECILLEPYYQYSLTVPVENVGRALNDIQRMEGTFQGPDMEGDWAKLQGLVPVSTMQGYVTTVHAYTHGTGKLSCRLAGYYPCHDQQEVLEQIRYDSEADLENPTGSVFCVHGAGFVVPWYEVRKYMHVESENLQETSMEVPATERRSAVSSEKEQVALDEIMAREFGTQRKRFDDYGNVYYSQEERKVIRTQSDAENKGDPKYQKKRAPQKAKKEYLLVDGYNMIFCWKELNELAKTSLDAARMKLMDLLCNYQGYEQIEVIVVFDAYKVKGNPGSVEKYHNIHVVFTKEAETADMYIEKVTHEIGKKYKVTVATSDGTEQVIVMQQGAYRMSATDLKNQLDWVNKQMESYLTTT